MAITKSQQTRKRKTLNEKECAAKDCKEMFAPRNMQHKTHHYLCAIAYQSELTAKRKKQENNREKKEFNKNDKATQMKLAQKTFNTFIRKRDEKLPCVSCGYVFTYLEGEKMEKGKQRQAGHLKTEAKNALLRFNEDNVHAQCNYCNDPFYGLKGNVGEYEKNLRERIGNERVDKLFEPKIVKKWTLEELHEIIETYKLKTKELNDHSSSTGL